MRAQGVTERPTGSLAIAPPDVVRLVLGLRPQAGIIFVLADGTGQSEETMPPAFLYVADGSIIRFTRGSFATTV